MLQFNGVLFRGTDEASLGIIIQDNERKEKRLPLDKLDNRNVTNYDIKLLSNYYL